MKEKTIIYTIELTDIVDNEEVEELGRKQNTWFDRLNKLALEMQTEGDFTLGEEYEKRKRGLEENIAEILGMENVNLKKLQVFEKE